MYFNNLACAITQHSSITFSASVCTFPHPPFNIDGGELVHIPISSGLQQTHNWSKFTAIYSIIKQECSTVSKTPCRHPCTVPANLEVWWLDLYIVSLYLESNPLCIHETPPSSCWCSNNFICAACPFPVVHNQMLITHTGEFFSTQFYGMWKLSDFKTRSIIKGQKQVKRLVFLVYNQFFETLKHLETIMYLFQYQWC